VFLLDILFHRMSVIVLFTTSIDSSSYRPGSVCAALALLLWGGLRSP
jgi:hypothetical protein